MIFSGAVRLIGWRATFSRRSMYFSSSQRSGRLEANHCSSSFVGHSHSCLQHCPRLLRWLQKRNPSCQPPSGSSEYLQLGYWWYAHYWQRDYFGAHTFRVLPGKENERFRSGEDIRMYSSQFAKLWWAYTFADVNWTGRGGNVSASTYNTWVYMLLGDWGTYWST